MRNTIMIIVAILILVSAGLWLSHRRGSSMVQSADSQQLISSVSYQCDDGKTIDAAYYQGSTTPAIAGEPPVPNGKVVIELSDGRSLTVPQTLSASGIRYANADESFIFWSKGITAFTEENGQQTYTNCLDASSLSQDLYPLYTSMEWNDPKAETTTIGTTTLFGVSVTSLPKTDIMDPGSVFVPFERYYADKLAALGWEIDPSLAAGGHTGSQTGYRKGSEVILTRSAITYHTTPENAPSECPCDVSVSAFSAHDPSL